MLWALNNMCRIELERRASPYRRAKRPILGQPRAQVATVDGDWKLVMATPVGERNSTLSLKIAGGLLTGTQRADGNTAKIFDGTVSGNDVTWKVSFSYHASTPNPASANRWANLSSPCSSTAENPMTHDYCGCIRPTGFIIIPASALNAPAQERDIFAHAPRLLLEYERKWARGFNESNRCGQAD
jgi:hypothetical protein